MRKKTARRALAALSLAAASALTFTACASGGNNSSGSESKDGIVPVNIGISQLVQHPALDAAVEGFKEAFADAGYKEGDTVKFDEQNANGEQSTAVSIAQNFATSNVDLVLAVATPAAQAAAQAITDKPIIFTAVTDAESAGLVKSNKKPGGNVTGTSDMAPIAEQFALLKEIVPDAKKVGIVYSSGEVNSEVQVKEATAAAKKLGIEIVGKTVSNGNEIPQATEALGDVDAIYVPTDNTVVSGISSLVQVAEGKKIPVIGAESGTVKGGAVATVGIDYKELGKQAGEMAIRILQGKEEPATTAVEVSKNFTYEVNEAAAKRFGLELPAELLKKAEKVTEE